jgi:DNA-binding XRE family transcriptional regulator
MSEEIKMISFDILDKRKMCGITRTALCKKIGVSKHLMMQYENNKSLPMPIYVKLKNLVPQWFMEGEN